MWRLSAFADEISDDLEVQLDTLDAVGISHIELRGVWGKNVLKLTDEEVDRVKRRLDERGFRVSSIGSPIGKIQITDPFEPHLEEFRRALWCAERLEAPYIRVFSFYVPEGEAAERRGEVMRRMKALVAEAEGKDVTLVHENEKHIYGDVPSRCLDLMETVNSPQLRAVWDPANFVQCGVRPHTEGYEMLRPFISYVHVKDALLGSGEVVPAGRGDGEVRETIRALRDSGFEGFFSLEPHLMAAGPFSGFSGPELFKTAAKAFQAILHEAGVAWE